MNHKTYERRVKVSNWIDRLEAEPLDNENPISGSHYRTLGESDKIYMPKSTAHESMEAVTKTKVCDRVMARKVVNFVSLPFFRLYAIDVRDYLHQDSVPTNETTYQKSYNTPVPLTEQKDPCDEPLDPYFNRIPVNNFIMSPASDSKFMDDRLVTLTEGRKRINKLRQMRNASNLFGVK